MSGAQERELFPGADDGSVGDQRLGAGVLGGDVATVDRGAQATVPSGCGTVVKVSHGPIAARLAISGAAPA